jgi:hypothetical protein
MVGLVGGIVGTILATKAPGFTAMIGGPETIATVATGALTYAGLRFSSKALKGNDGGSQRSN